MTILRGHTLLRGIMKMEVLMAMGPRMRSGTNKKRIKDCQEQRTGMPSAMKILSRHTNLRGIIDGNLVAEAQEVTFPGLATA